MADSEKLPIANKSKVVSKKGKANTSTIKKKGPTVNTIPKKNQIFQYLKQNDTDDTSQSSSGQQCSSETTRSEINVFYENCLK